MKIALADKKSQLLTPSSLPCLAKIPTINISAGCFHNCAYCYSRGYSNYPGDGNLTIFANLKNKLSAELARKRKLPYAVYFCPSCDPFQPVKEILDCSFELMKLLLYKNIGVQFVTKGQIPQRFLELFSNHKNLVSGQIGITCTDGQIRTIIEPNAATVEARIKNIKTLTTLCIDVMVRADPLIFGLTDSDKQIEELCSKISDAGAKHLAVSYLFLRPAIKKSLETNIANRDLLAKIIEPYKTGSKIKIGTCNSIGLTLPRDIRNQKYSHIRKIALQFGISVHICGCKNNDLVSESCQITKPKKTYENRLFEC